MDSLFNYPNNWLPICLLKHENTQVYSLWYHKKLPSSSQTFGETTAIMGCLSLQKPGRHFFGKIQCVMLLNMEKNPAEWRQRAKQEWGHAEDARLCKRAEESLLVSEKRREFEAVVGMWLSPCCKKIIFASLWSQMPPECTCFGRMHLTAREDA